MYILSIVVQNNGRLKKIKQKKTQHAPRFISKVTRLARPNDIPDSKCCP